MICTAAGWIRGCCLVAIEYAAGADGWAHYRPTQCSAGFLGRRASSIYFCMTETTRFGLGCIGMLSGILATTNRSLCWWIIGAARASTFSLQSKTPGLFLLYGVAYTFVRRLFWKNLHKASSWKMRRLQLRSSILYRS